MNDIILNALLEAVRTGNMGVEQVPILYQDEIEKRLNPQIEEEVTE